MIDATGELLAVGLFVGICAALMLGFPVAFTLAGVSLLFAVARATCWAISTSSSS